MLIVDDDEAVRQVVQDILEEEGYRVLVASSRTTALGILSTEDVALVLLDHVMPEDDDATGRALRRLDGSRPPTVLFSALNDAATIATAIGAEAWLRKPFEIDDLLAIVRRYAPMDHGSTGVAPQRDRPSPASAGSAARRTR